MPSPIQPGEQSMNELLAKRRNIYAQALRHQNEANEAIAGDDHDQTKFDASMVSHGRALSDLTRIELLIDGHKQLLSHDAQLVGTTKEASDLTPNEALHEKAFVAFMIGGNEAVQATCGPEGMQVLLYGVNGKDIDPDMKLGKAAAAGIQMTTKKTGNTVLAPETIRSEIIRTMAAWGGIVQKARIINTTNGNDISFPYFDRAARVPAGNEDIVEGGALGAAAEIATSKKTLKAYKNSTGILNVSWELLRDATVIDIRNFIIEVLAEDLARRTAKRYATADGVDSPLGLQTALLSANIPASQRWWLARVDGAADLFSWYLHWQDLVNLPFQIDDAYVQSPNAGYFFGRNFLRYVMTIRDSNNRPLWLPGLTQGAPNMFASYQYWIGYELNSAVPAVKDTDVFLAGFGDMKNYIVRRDGGVRVKRSEEYKFSTDEISFVMLNRFDAQVFDYRAFALLTAAKTAATAITGSGSLLFAAAAEKAKGVLVGSSTIA